MKFPFRLRILPLFLVIVFLMISVKFGDMWLEMGADDDLYVGRFSAQDLAESLATSGRAVAQDADEAPSLDGPETLEDGEQQAADGSGVPEGMSPAETVEEDSMFGDSGFGNMSPGEIRLLHDLVARRETLDKRERVVQEREALLKSAEQQLLEKQAQLQDIKSSIEDLLRVYQQEQSEEAKRLVRIYSSMKPKSAAQIFNDMDMPTLIQVFRGMKERTIAPIMAAMNAEKARMVTRELAEVDGAEEMQELLQ